VHFQAFLSAVVLGFFVGALARWAVPGPDPMPAWLTIFIGLTGAIVGGAVVVAITGYETRSDAFALLIASIGVSSLLVIGYRRFFQDRPVTGPAAQRLPTKGFGIARLRQKLHRMGIDPNSIGGPGGPKRVVDPTAETLRKLRELRDEGVLTQEEYEAKKAELEGKTS
jgi:uncharacterized membrane protein YeaQ/YmgE (transglycosylase-associated protein family)